MFTYFVPTGKCNAGFYCRAQITIYQDFSGVTGLEFGYSLWSFVDPDAKVPNSTIDRIKATTEEEILKYIEAISKAFEVDYPYETGHCKADIHDAIALFKKIVEGIDNCSTLSHGFCSQKQTFTRCTPITTAPGP